MTDPEKNQSIIRGHIYDNITEENVVAENSSYHDEYDIKFQSKENKLKLRGVRKWINDMGGLTSLTICL